MVALNSIVKDGHDDSFSCVSFLPCGSHVHVETILGATILKNLLRIILMSHKELGGKFIEIFITHKLIKHR